MNRDSLRKASGIFSSIMSMIFIAAIVSYGMFCLGRFLNGCQASVNLNLKNTQCSHAVENADGTTTYHNCKSNEHQPTDQQQKIDGVPVSWLN